MLMNTSPEVVATARTVHVDEPFSSSGCSALGGSWLMPAPDQSAATASNRVRSSAVGAVGAVGAAVEPSSGRRRS